MLESIRNWLRNFLGISLEGPRVEVACLTSPPTIELGQNDILVLMTEAVVGESIQKKIYETAATKFPGITILFLHGGLKMGVIKRKYDLVPEMTDKICTNQEVDNG